MTAVPVWTRQVVRLQQVLTDLEHGFRKRVQASGDTSMSQAAESISRWNTEREELEGYFVNSRKISSRSLKLESLRNPSTEPL